MNTLIETLQYFVLITIELIALFMFISALVEIILMYVPEEKIRKRLSGAGVFGNVIAAGFGALTPFCACSTIPMTVGFLNAGVPFGSTMSFLIASPFCPIRFYHGKDGNAKICEECTPKNNNLLLRRRTRES